MGRIALTTSCSLLTALFGGCLDATNPCDPDADADVRRTSTLRGVVKDQEGAPLAGVTVTVPGHPTPAITGDDGAFTFEGLPPSEGAAGYEVVALVDAPAVGGRTVTRPLGCEDEVSGVELVVAVPPASPEVEIVQATAADRLFVAFAGAAGSSRYAVEVRAPFETWQPAALADAPVTDPALAIASDDDARRLAYAALARPTSSEEHARAFCDGYRYLHASLESDNARCAEVVGVRDGDEVRLLDAHGSYEVRVRAEAVLDGELRAKQRLPDLVRSAATGVPGELSLVPTAMLPVMLHPDAEVHEETLRDMEVDAVVPVANGRFAMLGAGAGIEGVMIVGRAEVSSPERYADSEVAPTGALAMDDASVEAAAEVTADDGEGLALLPAGKWVRVWKRSVDPETLEPRSEVEKVFIGALHRSEEHGEQPEPAFGFDLDGAGLGAELRAFSWLVQPEGRVLGDGPYNPPDGYLLLLRSGYVLLERERLVDNGEALLSVFAETLADGSIDETYGSTGPNAPNAMTTGICGQLGDGALGADGALGDRTIRVCLDLEGALGETLDLTDVAILRSRPDAIDPTETFHVLSDAAGDRVLAVQSDCMLGRDALPLKDLISEVVTGVSPAALAPNRVLDCDGGSERPVVLVANRGSLDISVLGVVGEGAAARVDEIGVVGVPGVPVRFLDDPDGVSCRDPFTWVVLDDGRMVPLDLRAQHLGIPSCGGEACAVRARDRAPVGGVARDLDGRSRVVVGGRGMLGELGFLRPSSAGAASE